MSDISRRDFLNGIALTIAAGLTPARSSPRRRRVSARARPACAASIDGSFEVAHAMRDGEVPAFANRPIEEDYDLVVVGAGISGLAAAYFYRKQRARTPAS